MSELADFSDSAEFFAPASTDLIDSLIAQYRVMRGHVEQVASIVTGETAAAIGYFLDGNGRDGNRYGAPTVERLFQLDGAIAALNAAYWSKTLAMTDVLDLMPQKRRDEWDKSIMEMTAPDFIEDTVRATLSGLLSMRAQFLAERVDGIFRGLSGEHITNSPAGFGKRMIIGYVLNDYYGVNHGRAGLINDLRAVIAKFMGRDEPKWGATGSLVETLKSRFGEWVTVDSGALRIRLYKKGTAHLEVHPDMAWRLNSVLAGLYPAAIPEEFRRKPKREKRLKDFEMIQRPLPFAVLALLGGMKRGYRYEKQEGDRPLKHGPVPNSLQFDYGIDASKPARHEAERVLEAIGGVKTHGGIFQFDYSPDAIISEIVVSGCIPDQKAHQFYPTPHSLAEVAVGLAEIGPEDECLEPSAGLGGLADFMPKERTTCVEISELHAKVLKAKGFTVANYDFIKWAATVTPRFDRIAMNPPFSEGRWQAHVEAAARLIKPAGKVVAILPASARNKLNLPGYAVAWHGPYEREFSGTRISVVILVGEKSA